MEDFAKEDIRIELIFKQLFGMWAKFNILMNKFAGNEGLR